MKQPPTSPDPLPVRADESPEARARLRGRGALRLAIFALALELLPAVLAATGGRGRNAFATMGIAGGMIAGAALVRAFTTPSNVTAARWAVALGSAGVVVMMYHAPTCLAVAKFLVAISRGF